jgi:hypothetical protein
MATYPYPYVSGPPTNVSSNVSANQAVNQSTQDAINQSQNQAANQSTNQSQNASANQSQGQSYGTSYIPQYSEEPILESIAQQAQGYAQPMLDWANNNYQSSMGNVDQLLNMANEYASPQQISQDMGMAEATGMQAANQQKQAAEANLASYGIDPSSGRYQELESSNDVMAAAAAAGLGNQQRISDVQTGQALLSQGIAAQNAAQQTATSQMQLPNQYLATATQLKYPPLGQTSESTNQSAGWSVGSSAGQSTGSSSGESTGSSTGQSTGDTTGTSSGYSVGTSPTSGGGGSSSGGGTVANNPFAGQNQGNQGGSGYPASAYNPGSYPTTGLGNQTGYGGGGASSTINPFGDGGGGGSSGTGAGGPTDQFGNPVEAEPAGLPGTQADYSQYGSGDTGGDYYGYAGGGAVAAVNPVYGYQNGGGVWTGQGATRGGEGDAVAPFGMARGGFVPFNAMPFARGGGVVPPGLSPSAGARTDDVPAVVNQTGGAARLNADEFVIPRDVALWKGQEFFQRMIEKSRQDKTGAPARAQTTGRR